MSVAKILEISATSPEGFDHAVRNGIERASKTIKNIEGAWVKEQKVMMENGRVKEFQVDMKVTFLLEDG